jgi:hypothetical protein
MNKGTTDRILVALYCLSRDTCHIDATSLGRTAGVSATAAAEALVNLERAGLVDASRARLTMLGLARAARIEAAGGGGRRIDLRASSAVRTAAAPLAAAAVDEREEGALATY